MGRNTSISLSAHFESFISSESEVVRSALRLFESEDRKLKELRHALIEGKKSTMVENFDAKNHLEELHRRHL